MLGNETVSKLGHRQGKNKRRTHVLARGFHPDLAVVGFNDFFASNFAASSL